MKISGSECTKIAYLTNSHKGNPKEDKNKATLLQVDTYTYD